MSSTTYYNRHAQELGRQYDAIPSEIVHAGWVSRHLPEKPGFACDIGAGSGRDANWLASLGWDVIAVEPSKGMRQLAGPGSDPRVTWLDDALPGLNKLRALGHRFDLILVSAVWMHLPPGAQSRERAFRVLTELLKPGGVLIFTLRKGSDQDENAERGFHPVSADELIQFGKQRAIALTDQFSERDKRREHVAWETLVFTIPDDGTGSLPLLRHVIVNDDKSSSYKLGLLRVLTRIAEGCPGIVIHRSEDYVDIPLGIVGLYWLKQYKPLVLTHKIPQLPNTRQGMGFAGDDFYKLASISNYDLRVGASFDPERGAIVTGAIRDACRNITQMPARYISYPGENRPIFEFQWQSLRSKGRPITLSKDYLSKFGTFRIPARIWQTLGQYACWLEPAILREWSGLTASWSVADYQPTNASVFDWEEGRRDTGVAASRVVALKNDGIKVPCVWTASNIKSPHIDHCFPWVRWLNNDLWNLMPASASANLAKGDKLPSASTMADARKRILQWWQQAYLDSPLRDKFLLEAGSSLPNLRDGDMEAGDIFAAMLHQRARLRNDQQLVEWNSGR
ncbi:methyltransferase domain-containing protein [Seongchinamella sediminis]|uniref:Methyltransferase domain-containing protein n=1 Tax=Seongchinamella sediminis TaxID=2283635 RepID=A0A3L7E3A0_9GAMM|nr:class I SAM-dependent methyltransferase [Seongchinamella sediminis]RLQ23619.1 methyltransferase domain-containing protein [Seongchinamella sediminis]